MLALKVSSRQQCHCVAAREEARLIQACDGALPANTRHSRPQ
jgi:hypothetical protein